VEVNIAHGGLEWIRVGNKFALGETVTAEVREGRAWRRSELYFQHCNLAHRSGFVSYILKFGIKSGIPMLYLIDTVFISNSVRF
jgi:hypothetical protein